MMRFLHLVFKPRRRYHSTQLDASDLTAFDTFDHQVVSGDNIVCDQSDTLRRPAAMPRGIQYPNKYTTKP
jgi:hypothetical protein